MKKESPWVGVSCQVPHKQKREAVKGCWQETKKHRGGTEGGPAVRKNDELYCATQTQPVHKVEVWGCTILFGTILYRIRVNTLYFINVRERRSKDGNKIEIEKVAEAMSVFQLEKPLLH